MNKSFNNTIILFSLVLLFVFILLLFLFRSSLFSHLDSKLNIDNLLATSSLVLKTKVALNTELLKTGLFVTLTKHVVNFDFDNICFRPKTVQNTLLSNKPQQLFTDEATNTKTVLESKVLSVNPIINCRQGNDFPFIVKKK